MGYFQVRYDSRVVNYNRRGFIRLATEHYHQHLPTLDELPEMMKKVRPI